MPSRGHSSEQKKRRVTGAERFSSHLLQKSPGALGEAVKSWPRPIRGRLIFVFFFVRVWWRADFSSHVSGEISICTERFFFCLQNSGGACVSDEAQKMDCLKLLQLWSAVGTHRLQRGSAACRVALEGRAFFRSRTARRTRRSTQGKVNL